MPTLLGKRYKCATCGQEVLCVTAGDGEIECCGQPMDVQGAKQLPSAD